MRTVGHRASVVALAMLSACHGESDTADAGEEIRPISDGSTDRDRPRISDGDSIAATGWTPLGREETFADRSLESIVLSWADWLLGQATCEGPESDTNGSRCSSNQLATAPVFYLATGAYRTFRTECVIPRQKAILIPLAYIVTGGWVSPLEHVRNESDLKRLAERQRASIRDLSLRVDGMTIEGLEDQIVGPLRTSAVLPSETNHFSCRGYEAVPDEVDPLFISGAFVLLPPPETGRHVIDYAGTYSDDGFDIVQRVTASIWIE